MAGAGTVKIATARLLTSKGVIKPGEQLPTGLKKAELSKLDAFGGLAEVSLPPKPAATQSDNSGSQSGKSSKDSSTGAGAGDGSDGTNSEDQTSTDGSAQD
ncbi:hypothetical protein PsW64_02377 [Pseudovibrio sp. W64]|uniref:hypothetical protein n=1 Tax=unclassified Pseudovibrio TaxID=2627060 RepID=UPI0007AEABAC|nr:MULTISPECIES: hypothetical protein [unclassified Pseudovibrio]KZK81788.1 hypothetical protein PsW64_02377 [Pseudovibrio sp. W64]KZK95055.1 hypothetical protein PsW74_04317 [Pseudovibrio sp. W74]KZL08857.1 hypothetical protein PsAD14_02802 [Pseudovibrio sp. Ad14]